jgi:hypothetical protein
MPRPPLLILIARHRRNGCGGRRAGGSLGQGLGDTLHEAFRIAHMGHVNAPDAGIVILWRSRRSAESARA